MTLLSFPLAQEITYKAAEIERKFASIDLMLRIETKIQKLAHCQIWTELAFSNVTGGV